LRRIFTPRNVLLLLVALAAVVYYGSFVWTDYLWFSTQGYGSVFTTKVVSQLIVGLAAGVLAFLFILGNLLLARREGPPRPLDFITAGEMEVPFHIPGRIVNGLTVLGPLVVAVLVGSAASQGWLTVRKFLVAQPFGLADPLFGKDVGFYVFSLPFYRWLYGGVMAVTVLTFIVTALYYLTNRGIDFIGGRPRVARWAWTHLSFLLSVVLLVKAAGYFISQYMLVYSPRGVAFGASYTDVHAQLPVLRIMLVVAVAVAALLIVNARLRRMNLVVWGLGFLVVASLVLGSAYPAFVQQFTVEPDEISKETPYMIHNINFTRAAFDLDRIAEREFNVTNDLTMSDIQEESLTISNIRLWDWRPLRDTYGQIQTFRPYYDFADVDVDRYVIDGRYQQVTLAAREISYGLLPAQTWMNTHLKYTHGFGVVVSPTTAATSEGLPEFYIRDIPPVSTVEGLAVTQPRIYFGEMTDTYAIVNTADQEFDHPVGNQNAYTSYDGTGGIQLSSLARKVAFSIRLGSYQTVLASSITSESRVLIYRNIHQLVRELAPFLGYDDDPYLVIGEDGRIFYIQDAYTVTNLYPYSEPHRPTGVNYIRNSVKVVIDAYNGTVSYYVWDESDPVVATLRSIFPALFKDAGEMREDLAAHARYPEDLFSIQADMYMVYHMQDPQVFYNREDLWERPSMLHAESSRPTGFRGDAGRLIEPYYMIIRLPGEDEAELVQMLPLKPRDKNNMIAWLAARSDGENYGELVVFKFPKQELVYGPSQIDARIDQDTTISQNLTLWGQAGSEVIRGTLLVIPIENSVLYIEPLYLQASGNKLPQLKRVIVAYSDEVVMAQTLEDALRAIFGEGVPGPGPDEPDGAPVTVSELARRASELYNLMTEASARGDWAAFGDYLAELETVLAELEQLTSGGATGPGAQ